MNVCVLGGGGLNTCLNVWYDVVAVLEKMNVLCCCYF